MPDIAKINAVAIADIAKVDGILAANIEKVDGLTFPAAAFTGLLDETYGSGAAAAYSVRRLASATTVLLRVRRDTGTGGAEDDDEADVAYDSNNILSLDSAISNASAGVTATTLGQFINVGTVNGTTYSNPDSLTVTASCFVDTWYDQASSNDAEQATQGNQPQIHDGTADTDLIQENGKPALEFDGSNDRLDAGDNGDTTGNICIFGVGQSNINGAHFGPLVAKSAAAGVPNRWSAGLRRSIYKDSTGNGPTLDMTEDLTQQLASYIYLGGSSATIYQDASQDATASLSGSAGDNSFHLLVGGYGDATGTGGVYQTHNGTIQEVVYYNDDKSSNQTDIEDNINNHFAIGNFPNPTSGLLATYTGAAAAYSVRQLANTAPLSMRVRRDTAGGTGDDDEADVLFDFTLTDPTISLDSRINNPSAGVASTTLGEFLNATGYTDVDSLGTVADGFCDTWYDQSGNGNDVEQDVPGNQPKIFDSASPTDLINNNGKPALLYNIDLLGPSATAASASGGVLIATVNSYRNRQHFTYGDGSGQFFFQPSGTSLRYRGFGGDLNYTRTTTPATDEQELFCIERDSSNVAAMYLNGSSLVSGTRTATTSFDRIGTGNGSTVGSYSGYWQELVFWSSDKSTNRSDIETDINDFFSIY